MKVLKMIKKFRHCSQVVLNLEISTVPLSARKGDGQMTFFSFFLLPDGEVKAEVSVLVVMVAQPLTWSPKATENES